jgi:spermidine/putrescine transport system ATP-binding protein
MTSAVSLHDVRKDFGSLTALSDVTLEIEDNEFFTLLGPSGCGKTTLLRMIAGFEGATAGTIRLFGDEIEHLPPNKRPVNTVFQNYAIFPHMNVAENIGFSLRMLGWTKLEIQTRVDEMVEMVKLGALVDRKPSQISGGQQQRVALARAMAPRPKVLLLDEPLSALDLKLRQEMRTELKRLQRDTGITFIFVTHDQEEALSMSDRIAVMSNGKVQQIGTPFQIYEHPNNRFIADFIGETNMLPATLDTVDGLNVVCHLNDGQKLDALANCQNMPGAIGVLSLRPERLSISKTKPTGRILKGELGDRVYLGTDTQFTIKLSAELKLKVRMQNSFFEGSNYKTGDTVFVTIADGAARFLVD